MLGLLGGTHLGRAGLAGLDVLVVVRHRRSLLPSFDDLGPAAPRWPGVVLGPYRTKEDTTFGALPPRGLPGGPPGHRARPGADRLRPVSRHGVHSVEKPRPRWHVLIEQQCVPVEAFKHGSDRFGNTHLLPSARRG